MEQEKTMMKKKPSSLSEILESTPHTEVELPSKGLIYPKDNVLSKGKLHIRYLKGEDEEILLSPTHIKNTGFIDLLIKRVVLEPDFNIKDLSVGDKTYIVLASRIASLGDDYIVKEVKCNFCDHVEENVEFKISESLKEAPEIHSPVSNYKNVFKTTLPVSGHEVFMKTITGHDTDKLTNMSEKLQNVGQELSSMHTYSVLIVSSSGLDENASEGEKLKYVRDLTMKDTNHLRKFLNEIRMTPDNTIDYKCSKCNTKQEIPISFGFDFFFPEH